MGGKHHRGVAGGHAQSGDLRWTKPLQNPVHRHDAEVHFALVCLLAKPLPCRGERRTVNRIVVRFLHLVAAHDNDAASRQLATAAIEPPEALSQRIETRTLGHQAWLAVT